MHQSSFVINSIKTHVRSSVVLSNHLTKYCITWLSFSRQMYHRNAQVESGLKLGPWPDGSTVSGTCL